MSIERPVGNDQVVVGTDAAARRFARPLLPRQLTTRSGSGFATPALASTRSNRTVVPTGAAPTYKPTGLLQDFGEARRRRRH